MKFLLTYTDNNSKHPDLPIITKKDYLLPEEYQVLEIETLEDLINFCKDAKQDIIIKKPDEREKEFDYEIEVYNGYRE